MFLVRAADHIHEDNQMGLAQVFIYLQLLDLLTTLVGFKLGAAEASPFIRMLMHFGPATGVAVSKLVALGLGGLCVYLKKQHLDQVGDLLVRRPGRLEPDDHALRIRTASGEAGPANGHELGRGELSRTLQSVAPITAPAFSSLI